MAWFFLFSFVPFSTYSLPSSPLKPFIRQFM
jgi:hypothetical protein